MKTLIHSMAFFAIATLSAQAQNSAFDNLEAFGNSRGKALLKRTVAITGAMGQHQPAQWLLLSKDVNVSNLVHEYAMKKGKVVAERHFTSTPEQRMPTKAMPLDRLNIDSEAAFQTANRTAAKSHIGFDSINYLLRIQPNGSTPVWTLTLIDQQKKIVGVIFISASSGKLLSKKWYHPGTVEYTEINSRSAADELKNIWNKSINSVSKGIKKLDKKIGEKLNKK
ncbi:MAG: hypothetical protein L3J39_17850 [Verrucomicrobiales bacterium]|nr:hypothetical protein [Verrucomicrobiales bacterium]